MDRAGIGKRGACHLFRHTMATLMLENGADIRFIQQMLGHAELTTTQIYTQVSIRKLKEIHTATHPGAKLERTVAHDSTREAGAEDDAGEVATQDVTHHAEPPATREALLSSLAAEAAEEETEEAGH